MVGGFEHTRVVGESHHDDHHTRCPPALVFSLLLGKKCGGKLPLGFSTFAFIPLPPGLNGITASVRPLLLNLQGSKLTRVLAYRTQSTGPNYGRTPASSYGVFLRDNGQPSISHPTYRPFRGRIIAHRGLAICFAILLFQTILIICRSDTLAKFYDLTSTALRASREKSALVTEREKSEQRREQMRRDRELWEKVPEYRVPEGAFWDAVRPAVECRAYGKREYSAMLQNIPEGWSAIDACMSMPPVEIEGVSGRRPHRCAFADGSPHIYGYWMVDWNQTDCQPRYENFHDAVSQRFSIYTVQPCSHISGMYELWVWYPSN